MSETETGCGCKVSNLGYLHWFSDADRRHKAGQRQVYCLVCRKWQWPDHVGPHADTMTERAFKAMEKRQARNQ